MLFRSRARYQRPNARTDDAPAARYVTGITAAPAGSRYPRRTLWTGDKVLGGIAAAGDTVWAAGCYLKTNVGRSPLIDLYLSA